MVVFDLTTKKIILFFYITALDFNTLDPAFLQHQYSFPEMRVLKVVKIFFYGPLNFFNGYEVLPRGNRGYGQASRIWNPAVFPSPILSCVQVLRLVKLYFFIFQVKPSRKFWHPTSQEGVSIVCSTT